MIKGSLLLSAPIVKHLIFVIFRPFAQKPLMDKFLPNLVQDVSSQA